jgi:sarcosine oxidase, subunit gamma
VPDHRLTALTPLGATEPISERIGSLRLTERTDRALGSLACRLGKEAAFAERARAALGLDLPGPGRSVAADPFIVFWTGPDQYFVEAPLATHEDIARRLRDGFGATASVTEQSDAWARFEVQGDATTAMFERLCNLDLARMGPRHVTRTTIEHMGVFLACETPGQAYVVTGPRSSAGSLYHALTTAAIAVS